MTWNATFPTPTTRINQSVTQIQNNWAFLATNINTDHYFNTGTNTEGHHKFVQMAAGADPALAAGMNGVIYTKNNGAGLAEPFFRNASVISQIPIIYTITNPTGAPGNNIPLFDLSTLPATFSALFTIYQVGGSANQASGMVVWDGSTVQVSQITAGGVGNNLTAVDQDNVSGPGNYITISYTTIVGVVNWKLSMLVMAN